MATRVAINGFGRIGRSFFRAANGRGEIDIVAINDLAAAENLIYLLKHDSVYGDFEGSVELKEKEGKRFLSVGKKETVVLQEKDPSRLPWRSLHIDVVVESTGVFAGYGKSRAHLDAGAKRVVVTAPVKDEPPEGIGGATVLIGVNEDEFKNIDISSNASCTTNAGSPIIQILHEAIGIEKALLNTVHGYTASQSLVDSPNGRDVRRGRAAAVNIVPSSTGAAIAITKAVKELRGLFDGIALRVPVSAGSIADITFISSRDTTVEEVNDILKTAAREERWQSIFSVTDEPIVSSDIVGSTYASIADLSFTRVVGGNLVKVLSWYDNEMGYAYSLVEHVIKSGSYVGGSD